MQTSEEMPRVQRVISVMWPSFITAGVATILFFATFDPEIILPISGFPNVTRTGAYSIGFFCFWMLTASSCALTCYFRQPCERINKSE